MRRWLVFGNHVLSKNTLPPRERELLILRTGWRCRSEYEWGQHVLIAREAGLTDVEIDALAGDDDHPWSDSDRVLIRAVDELHDDARVSDATWAALSETWDTRQLMDLVFTVGQYHLVSYALNSFGVQRDEGVPGLPR
jgi:alkylhydroperoxidase family enzyme